MAQGIGVTPGPRARITGVVYLFYFLTAVLAQLLSGRKMVALGDLGNLVANTLYIVLTLLFYFLFRPAGRMLSLIAALFGLTGCVIASLGLFHLVPANLNPLWFFGPYCILIGILILRSTFLPRLLGGLMVLAGVGWMAFLSPALARRMSVPIEGLGIVAEASLMLWLLIKGVNEERWRQQAGAE
jgi:hypothetical protein